MSNIKDFKQKALSNQYYSFVNNFAQTDYESSKLLGKFYTNYDVAEEMISRMLKHLTPPEESLAYRIIDPFCGDGRLIIKLLQALIQDKRFDSVPLYISVWDIDEEAVATAQKEIEDFLIAHKRAVQISAEKTDAFVSYYEEAGTYDACVTNPPWGLLKPQKLFNSRCCDEELEKYKDSISTYDDYMKKEFSISQPTSKFGKWGTNLGRCGLEVAMKLISSTGICGFVSPASLFNDQVSAPFRKWIFDEFRLNSVTYYPAELKLYGPADVSSITAVVTPGKTDTTIIRLYDTDNNYTERQLSSHDVASVRKNEYRLPLEFGMEALSLQVQIDELNTLEDYCNQNALYFTRELDETRLSEKVQQSGKIIFAKGYMVDRYSFTPDGLYLKEDIITAPKTVMHPKLVWRDVSRNSQKRRVKAALLPKHCIAGNSLGVIYSENNDEIVLKVLLAIINSFVFEFQARRQLVSNHVPAGVLKKLRIPSIDINDYIVSLVDGRLRGDDNEALIEIWAAKMYGLDFETFIMIVDTFDVDKNEKQKLVNAWNS